MKNIDVNKGGYKLILDLGCGILIKADTLNWVLITPPRNYWYYPSLDNLFVDLLDYKIKFYAYQSKRGSIEELCEAIYKARQEVYSAVNKLTDPKTLTQDRLRAYGDHSRSKND